MDHRDLEAGVLLVLTGAVLLVLCVGTPRLDFETLAPPVALLLIAGAGLVVRGLRRRRDG